MDAINDTVTQAQGLIHSFNPWYFSVALLPLLIFLVFQPWNASKEPPSMRATIPYISNGYQFMTDKPAFVKRLEKAFRNASIVKFNIGWKTIYVVSGASNIQNLFRSGHGISDDIMMRTAAEFLWGLPREDLDKFVNDKSGRAKIPKPGYESIPAHERQWAINHEIYDKYLSSKEYANASARKYFEIFSAKLDKFPLGEWTTISLADMFRKDMAHCAVQALMGDKILELNPGFLETYWAFERYLIEFLAGLPKWLNPRPYRARDKFVAMTLKWAKSAWKNFDWDGPDADATWDPHFGARINREIAQWWNKNFAFEGQAGFFASFLLAQNSNTIPACTWCMMHLLDDRELYRAVRDEVLTAVTVDPDTGARALDPQAVGALPTLNALYTETLRFHVTFNIMREVTDDIRMDGYDLKKGASIQASTHIAHFDESLWGRQDGSSSSSSSHPASEFWIGRFLEYEDKVDETTGETTREPRFISSTRPGSYFPYGGGTAMCPGRSFARQEILITVAILVSKFDIEFIDWTFPDGRKSDRPAQPATVSVGSGVVRPDRDMKVRWKRLW